MPKFEPVAYMQLSVEEGVDTYFPRLHKPEKYNKDWWRFDPPHSADQLTEAYEAGKREQASELEAARAEIERLKTVPMKYRRMAFNAHLQDENAKLSKQLAAEQAKNVGMRELVEHFALIDLGKSLLPDDFGLWVLRARKAIAPPSDTSALEALVAKAGEKMREMCIAEFLTRTHWYAEENMRALPAVTLEDLK
jgi:hypothetical protein